MPAYDAIVVFGNRLREKNGSEREFEPFVYQEIDRAVELLSRGAAPLLVFCGNYWAGEADRGIRECDVAEAYMSRRHPEYLPQFRKEGRSTCVQENWAYLRLTYPELRRLHQVTIAPLLPRMKFVGQQMYEDHGQLSFEALPWPDTEFRHEEKLLQVAGCIFESVDPLKSRKRSPYEILLQDGVSCWQELWKAHGGCAKCFS
ncbi:MAG TPA: ElyC/SanA/YdcF family protein [Candidatus Saccharimonadia bacterium]|nr:ElyC/SanA/YdcF family protein [Candidatus Saccharimonadia bacterium]